MRGGIAYSGNFVTRGRFRIRAASATGKRGALTLSARFSGGRGRGPREAREGEVGYGARTRNTPCLSATTSPTLCFAMGPFLSPASRRRGPWANDDGLFIQIEQPLVLVEGEAVGHAGDVVGDQAGAGLGAGRLGRLAPRRRQAVGLGEQQPEQVGHDAARLGVRAVELPVLVHALVEEGLH